MKLLEVKNLDVSFMSGRKKIKILNGISFDIGENEALAVIGETGCGKSVAGSAALRLLPENAVVSGSIKYRRRNIIEMSEEEFRPLRGREIAVIPQSPAASLDPLMRVGEQAAECITRGKRLAGSRKRSVRERVRAAFSSLMLPNESRIYNSYPCELSGGMQQRALISMGIIAQPKLLIVDEPTKAVDWALKKEVVQVLLRLKQDMKCAMLFITHDIPAAKLVADRIAVMYCGEIVETGAADEVLANPRHPYTKGLINAMPSRGFRVMDGFMPSFLEIPSGCRFHPRCTEKTDLCAREAPTDSRAGGSLVKCHRFKYADKGEAGPVYAAGD